MSNDAYDWKQEADREGGNQAERLPAGEHDVEISKVLFGSGRGDFRSKAGDPQIMLIFADPQGREASLMVTCSDKAGWVLARIMSAAGANLQRMMADGVKPAHFGDEQFATANLVGRRLRVQVEWPEGGKYANVTPVRREAAAAQAAGSPPPAGNLGTIPF